MDRLTTEQLRVEGSLEAFDEIARRLSDLKRDNDSIERTTEFIWRVVESLHVEAAVTTPPKCSRIS